MDLQRVLEWNWDSNLTDEKFAWLTLRFASKEISVKLQTLDREGPAKGHIAASTWKTSKLCSLEP